MEDPKKVLRNDQKEARITEFKKLMNSAMHLFSENLIDDLKKNGFFTSPASTKYHNAFEGGLFEHSRNVVQVLVMLTQDNKLMWQRPESPYIIGMFHDLCKIDAYWHRPGTFSDKWYEHNSRALLKGHGDKSVMLLSQYCQLTLEEILCIRYHMGAFVDQREEWNDYIRAVQRFDTVLWTHHADMIASNLIER